MTAQRVDVLIVGAGLSGVGAAYQLSKAFPRKSIAVLESRSRIGGTWDLFRYPGIRSDSDMHTLGYRFRPWSESESLADGPSIRRYIRDTAREGDVERLIRFHHRVVSAEWSTPDQEWTVQSLRTDPDSGVETPVTMRAGFVFLCTGYYRYDAGYLPDFPGMGDFRGDLLHPQFWPEDLDYSGKRVVVIGSGATAVTLVPAMAEAAEHVTMLQRSPTYIIALPGRDPVAVALKRWLPDRVVFPVVRWKNIVLQMASYQISQRWPKLAKAMIRKSQQPLLPAGFDFDTHLAPDYKPWDQRLCVVPRGDLFRAVRHGKASIVTDTIATFTEHGIRLTSGAELEADVVVTATGLNLQVMGGLTLRTDGEDVDLTTRMTYKSMMLSDVPNMAFAAGYTNASWTLKVDLTYGYLIKLLRHMDAHGYTTAVPRNRDPSVEPKPFMEFQPGYVQRSIHLFPKQGSKPPWRLRMNYLLDVITLRLHRVDDGVMEFRRAPVREQPRATADLDA